MEQVVIIGAGPVGLMLACELSLTGARPIVLERRAGPSDLPKANGLGGQIVQLLDNRGLLGRFAEDSPFFGRPPGFPFGSVPLRFDGLDDVPLRVLMIQQPRLESLLRERAAELGVEIRWGHEVESLAEDPDGVTLTGRAFEPRPRSGPGFELRARYVVGCDGGHSTVRRLAGIGFPGTTDDEVLRLGHFATADTTHVFENPCYDGLEPGWNRTPHGRLLLTSLREGAYVVGVKEKRDPGEQPDRREEVTPADFAAAVRRVLGRDLPLGEPIWLSSTVGQARLAERYRTGRVFLAGDAAHLFPAGGSALNVGLTDAVNLGWKLSAELAGHAPAWLLDTYEAERRPVGAHTLAHTRAQAALESQSGENGDALRGLLAELFAYDQPARHLAELLHGGDTRYPVPGPLQAAGQPHPLVGRLAPDLALTTAAGPTRLAELLHQGRPLLLDLAGGTAASGGPIDVVTATTADPPADALLIRPDGHVAWAGAEGLAEATAAWFTPASA
ncbi:FAD-dependent oxidoreductase [Nonomuraea sp. NN258]|uniref:FAD-dependent monooxygenase n=1 Tax=Nonomuraea antri TaxID=2730852 RepID=UPI001567DFD4|nr:FAD-dependent monooxygenase [Nonomuraea antri]NRQ36593.1 FAD-dependent oxidoreductase [Nonomuraea antri]